MLRLSTYVSVCLKMRDIKSIAQEGVVYHHDYSGETGLFTGRLGVWCVVEVFRKEANIPCNFKRRVPIELLLVNSAL